MSTVHRIACSVRRPPLPAPRPVPSSSLHPRHAMHTAAPRQLRGPSTLSRGGRPLPGGQPWLSAGTATCPLAPAHAEFPPRQPGRWPGGLRRSRPPAAAARCLLLSCPTRQPPGLGYRAVSNFVPVPRHQGRGT